MITVLRSFLSLLVRRACRCLADRSTFDKSIGLLEKIVQTTPDDDGSKPSTLPREPWQSVGGVALALLDPFELLMRLGAQFPAHFRKVGEAGDLERSIAVTEDALALTPVRYHDAARSYVVSIYTGACRSLLMSSARGHVRAFVILDGPHASKENLVSSCLDWCSPFHER
ncbi:hypothetical protein OG21DRAFT_640786 [Imleria badia]|nr:hypothetical protein OG21DRAFT_640786 [Imleria badia]